MSSRMSTKPILPLELIESIICLAVVSGIRAGDRGSYSLFSRLTSVSRSVRNAVFESGVVRARILIGAFGIGGALEEVVVGDGGGGKTWRSTAALVPALLRLGADPSAAEASALRLACRKNDEDLVIQVLRFVPAAEAKLLVAVRDNECLREACRSGNKAIARALLAAGADIHARADEALRYAACFGNADMAQFLIDNGADVTALNNTSLFESIDKTHEHIVRILLASGSDPNVTRYGILGGQSVLQAAVAKKSLENIQKLLAYGANPSYNNGAAKRDALRLGALDIVKLLEKAESTTTPSPILN